MNVRKKLASEGRGRTENIRERKQRELTKAHSQKGALRIRETERRPGCSIQETEGEVKHEMWLGRWGKVACRAF